MVDEGEDVETRCNAEGWAPISYEWRSWDGVRERRLAENNPVAVLRYELLATT